MDVTLMAVAHAVANGHATDVAFFGGIAVFALVSYRYQVLCKLAGDPKFRRFDPVTAFVPFTRRGAVRRLRDLFPLAVIAGIAVALVSRFLRHLTLVCPSRLLGHSTLHTSSS